MRLVLFLLATGLAWSQTPTYTANISVPLPAIKATVPMTSITIPSVPVTQPAQTIKVGGTTVTVPSQTLSIPTWTLTIPLITAASSPKTVTVPVSLPLASLLPAGAVWTGLGTTLPSTCGTTTPALFVLVDTVQQTMTWYICSTSGEYVSPSIDQALGVPQPDVEP